MKLFTTFAFSLSLLCGEVRGDSLRVASINLCADQLVLLLADKEQIVSVSNLSHDGAGSYFFKRAKNYKPNNGSAETIIRLQPDVVIAGQYSNPHTVRLLQDAGLQVQVLPIETSVDSVLENIVRVADWVGQSPRGAEWVSKLKVRLSRLKPAAEPKPIAAVYDPNGYTTGSSTLRGEMMSLAGWGNAASLAGIESYGKLTLEQLIHLKPVALIESPYSPGTYSRAQTMSQHPALYQSGLDPHVINVPSRMTVCGGPWTIDVIEQLQAERLTLQHHEQ